MRRSRKLLLAYVSAVCAVTIAGGAVRGARLGHPMRYDESYTYLFYIAPPHPVSVLAYSAPNNHVLHTLLVRAIAAGGGASPEALRMPAFLAGVALVPAAAELARRLSGRRVAGLLAAMLVAGSSILIEYSVNARGYSMVCLAAVVLVILTLELARDSSRRRLWIGWVAVAACGMLTIPVMLYPVAICVALFVLQRVLRRGEAEGVLPALRRLGAALLAAAAATLVLYTPVFLVSGLDAVLANPFVTPRPSAEVLRELPAAAAAALGHWSRDTSWPWWLVTGAGLAGALAAGVRRRDAFRMSPPVAALLLAAAALLHRVVPFPRVWLFLLPVTLAVAACGLVDLAALVRSRRTAWVTTAALAALVAVASADAARRALVRPAMMSEDPDRRVLLDSEAIIRDVAAEARGQATVAWDWRHASWPPLAYYARREDLPVGDVDRSEAFIVVHEQTTLAAALKANPRLAENFGPPALHRHYARADVYVARRRAPAARRAGP